MTALRVTIMSGSIFLSACGVGQPQTREATAEPVPDAQMRQDAMKRDRVGRDPLSGTLYQTTREVRVWIDPQTGCQWLVGGEGGYDATLVPRTRPSNRSNATYATEQVCG